MNVPANPDPDFDADDLEELRTEFYERKEADGAFPDCELFYDFMVKQVMDISVGETFIMNNTPFKVTHTTMYGPSLKVRDLSLSEGEPYQERELEDSLFFLDWFRGEVTPVKEVGEYVERDATAIATPADERFTDDDAAPNEVSTDE